MEILAAARVQLQQGKLKPEEYGQIKDAFLRANILSINAAAGFACGVVTGENIQSDPRCPKAVYIKMTRRSFSAASQFDTAKALLLHDLKASSPTIPVSERASVSSTARSPFFRAPVGVPAPCSGASGHALYGFRRGNSHSLNRYCRLWRGSRPRRSTRTRRSFSPGTGSARGWRRTRRSLRCTSAQKRRIRCADDPGSRRNRPTARTFSYGRRAAGLSATQVPSKRHGERGSPCAARSCDEAAAATAKACNFAEAEQQVGKSTACLSFTRLLPRCHLDASPL